MKKYISWNVNGIRACIKKGFLDFLTEESPDALCIQETKMQEGQEIIETPGYLQYWSSAEKKGYSGTLILVNEKTLGEPLAVTTGIGIDEHDKEGRVVTAEFDDHYLVTVYTPNSQDGLKRLDYRMEWEDAFRGYLKSLETGALSGGESDVKKTAPENELSVEAGIEKELSVETGFEKRLSGEAKPVIVCGDMNVAHEEIDLKNPKTNHKNAGFTDEERSKMTELLGAGFIDTFRYFYPDAEGIYSWWSYRFNARANNAGWRIDYFLVSEEIKERLRDARILTEVYGSDHCPVVLDWE